MKKKVKPDFLLRFWISSDTYERTSKVHESQLQWTEEIYYDKILGGYLIEGVFHLCLDKFHEETESQIMNVFAEKRYSPTWSNNCFKSVPEQQDRLKWG